MYSSSNAASSCLQKIHSPFILTRRHQSLISSQNTKLFGQNIFIMCRKTKYNIDKKKKQFQKLIKHPTYYFFLIVSNVAASVSLVVNPFLTKTFIILIYREYAHVPLHKKGPNMEFFLVHIFLYSHQEKLRIWTLFTQCTLF